MPPVTRQPALAGHHALDQEPGKAPHSLAGLGNPMATAATAMPSASRIPRPRPTSPIETRSSAANSSAAKPTLGPAPAFLEQSRSRFPALKSPETPKKAGLGLRGISLQLSVPANDSSGSGGDGEEAVMSKQPPSSPKPDPSSGYTSPGSVLPRRSRGLDYTRACTNLHHSMIAEQSSPDSSPVIGGRGGMNIPRRTYMLGAGTGPDSPMFQGANWGATNGLGEHAKPTMAGSLGSVKMQDSGSDSDSSDDDMANDEENTIHMTPQPFRSTNIFGTAANASPGMENMSSFSQAAASLMSFQRRTRKSRSTRHSSSSASGRSSMPSPAPGSPPLHKAVESSSAQSYFDRQVKSKSLESRRESLSLGTNDLKISDSVDEDSGDHSSMSDALGLSLNTSSIDGRRNVIKRAVTRRSNMMPKPKTFARIRAALQEEGSPVDTEFRREAEVIRQVRESDNPNDTAAVASQPATTVSSPSLMPTNNKDEALEDLTELMAGEVTIDSRRGSLSAKNPHLRNSMGFELADLRTRTPPPPFFGRSNSSGIGEESAVDTPASSLHSLNHTRNSSPSRSSTPLQAHAEATRRALGKRRRDDDLDPSFFKRRAVSPGVSHASSPILPPSPAQREGAFWSSQAIHRSGSTGSSGVAGSVGKMVGLKGMNDTNDGLMNMTIE